MIIRLKDGSEKEYAQPMSVLDIAKDIADGLGVDLEIIRSSYYSFRR